MAVYYKKTEKANPQKREEPKKWYVSLNSLGMKKENEVAVLAADGTTLDPKEAQLAYSRFGIVLMRLLLDGHTVEIENLGSFRLTVNSEGVDKKEDVSPKQIKKVNLRFVPCEAAKDMLKKANFKELKTK
jgi:hypothetical protein